MIEAGLGWKFRDHVADRIIFEDQVVENIVTGHLARRRVYPERLSRDETALNCIKRQIAASSKIEHPGFQRLFLAGDSAGYFTVIGELNDAPPLTVAAERKLYTKARDWHGFALRFARFCVEMQRLRIALDRLNLDDIQFHRNMFQISNRFPVGILDDATILASPYLQRLMESPVGGAYSTDKGQYPLEAGMRKVKEFLFTMASGQTARDVRQMLEYRQESARVTGSKQYTSLGIEPVIESLILRMHEPMDTHPIRNFDQLVQALESVPDEELQSSSPSGNLGSGAAVPGSSPSSSSGSIAAARPAVRADPGTGERPQSVPRAYTPTGKSDVPMESSERQKLDEEEDRSYLYPQRDTVNPTAKGRGPGTTSPKPDPSTGPKSDPGTGSLYTPGAPARPLKRRRDTGAALAMVGKIVGALVVVALLGFAGWYVWASMQAPPPNAKPVAAFAALPATMGVNKEFALDGSLSTDADGQSLVYSWTVYSVDPQGVQGKALGTIEHRLLPNGTDGAARPNLMIFQAGRYRIELKVFDGQSYSEPSFADIEIVN